MANPNDDVSMLFVTGVPRKNPDGTCTIYCRRCGRPIMRQARPQITTVTSCALCLLRDQGVENPEQHVLQSYLMTDPTAPPIPLEDTDPMMALYPEESVMKRGKLPPSGGVIGTVKSMFRAVVGWFGQEEEEAKVENKELLSKKISKRKRSGGLWER